MTEREVTICNRSGLHARAAARLVHLANRFESDILLVCDGQVVDAKSILGILLLAAAQGMNVVLRCDGADEDAALAALVELVEDGFGEPLP